jgi:putative phosphonate metabolism protein
LGQENGKDHDMKFTRYAVYFTPLQGPLAAFGAAWLGWDSASGQRMAHPQIEGLPMQVAAITATPRKYGLHATIKPPFRLAEGRTAHDLATALSDLTKRLAPVSLDALDLRRIGGFLALVPQGDTPALNALAAEVVRGLDPLRAPPGAADLARRRASGLTPRQNDLLQHWGYPYVMEEFRFHITLSGKMEAQDLDAVESALAPRLAPLLPRPFPIGHLTLSGEDKDGMFHDIHRYTLAG